MNKQQWFLPFMRAHARRFMLIMVLSALALSSAMALMYMSGYLISKSALQPENILMVYVPVVLVRTFGISRAVLHYMERLVSHDTVLRILAKMRVQLYRILEPQALLIRSRFRTGDMLSVLSDDIEQLQNVYLRTVFPTITALALCAVGVLALGTFDVYFALLIALHAAVVLVLLPIISLLVTKVKHEQSKQQRNKLYQQLTDAVLGMGDWLISGRAAQFVQAYETEEQKLAYVERKLQQWARWRTLIAQCIVGCIVVYMIIWSGLQVEQGLISPVLIASFVLVVFPWMDVFLPISEAIEKVPRYKDSLQRLNSLSGTELNKRQQHLHLADQLEQAGVYSDDKIMQADTDSFAQLEQAEAYPEHNAHIEVKQLTYAYDRDGDTDSKSFALHNISLTIPQGKKLAILGRSGAGKSTLIKLLQGVFAPQHGQVLMNGLPAWRLEEELASKLAVLNQSPHLFDTTIANNLRLGKPHATDEELRKVARQVQLLELIDSLPQGFHTPMLETGSRFSGGERQRIALARILLQDTPVVILDEPTIGLDPATEKALLRTIFQALQEKTLIWITHHLVGVEQMDEIVVLDEGRIKLQGSHSELMAQEPYYRSLYALDRPSRIIM